MYQNLIGTIAVIIAALSLTIQIYTIEPHQPPAQLPPPVVLRVT